MLKRMIKIATIGLTTLAITAGAFLAGNYYGAVSAGTTERASQPQNSNTFYSYNVSGFESGFSMLDIDSLDESGFESGFAMLDLDSFDDVIGFDAIAQVASDEPGIVIVVVEKDSPAAKAGVKRGDILLKVNETVINNPHDASTVAQTLKVGDKIKLTVTHGDETRVLEVTVGDKNGRPYLGMAPFGVPRLGVIRAMPPGAMPLGKVRVTQVVTDSPAAKAGVKVGDVIVEIDGKKIDKPLQQIIASYKPGDVVKLKVERGNETPELTVTLGDNPDRKGVAYLGVTFAPAMPPLPPGGPNRPMPPQLPPIRPGAPISGTQVVVANVSAASPAEKAGLKRGDVIEAIDAVKVTDPKTLSDEISKRKPGDNLKLTIRKANETTSTEVTVTLGEHPNDKTKAYLGVSLGFGLPSPRPRNAPGNNRQGAMPPLRDQLRNFGIPNFNFVPFQQQAPKPEGSNL
jgi:S1-C subfamily serine protease